ncbi:hypothetical protein C8F04DRAFT_1117476 [Mycena alexandri]|uniref:Uncharacterized protein n=1 Tax=Mycena alexandri TaxID=1745969 RepID=A0AAD6WVN2_9AGAR|nr:hypothetical protein C8F04DRAFT_1117476 [Mycena alexandri]
MTAAQWHKTSPEEYRRKTNGSDLIVEQFISDDMLLHYPESLTAMGVIGGRVFPMEDVGLRTRTAKTPVLVELPIETIFLMNSNGNGETPQEEGHAALLNLPSTPIELDSTLPHGFQYLDTGRLAEGLCRGLVGYGYHNFPVDDRRWFSVATAHTRCPVSYSHMTTAIIVESGKRLLWVAQSSTGTLTNGIEHTADEMSFIKGVKWWGAVVLPGTMFVLRPNTHYMTYAMETSLIRGFSFFSVSHTLESVCAMYRKAFWAPRELLNAFPLLGRMLGFWFFNLSRNEPSSDAMIKAHMPDIRSWEDFIALISLGNLLLLSDALDVRSYSDLPPRGDSDEILERRTAQGHFENFRNWFLRHYQVVSPQWKKGSFDVFRVSLLDAATVLTVLFRSLPDEQRNLYQWTASGFFDQVLLILRKQDLQSENVLATLEPLAFQYAIQIEGDGVLNGHLIPLAHMTHTIQVKPNSDGYTRTQGT